jgi:hypothetical protein
MGGLSHSRESNPMSNAGLMAFIFSQIWSLPHLVLLVFGAVFVLSHGRREKFVTYAFWGFSLMAAGVLFAAGQQYWMFALMNEGIPSSEVAGKVYGMKMMLLNRALYLGGLGLVVAAIVTGRPKKPVAGQA